MQSFETATAAEATRHFGALLRNGFGLREAESLRHFPMASRRHLPSLSEIDGWINGRWLPDPDLFSDLTGHLCETHGHKQSALDQLEDLYALGSENQHRIFLEAVRTLANQVGARDLKTFAKMLATVSMPGHATYLTQYRALSAKTMERWLAGAKQLGAADESINAAIEVYKSETHADRSFAGELTRAFAHCLANSRIKMWSLSTGCMKLDMVASSLPFFAIF